MTEPTPIRTLRAIANKVNLNVDHLDIKTAFLSGILPPDEQFFCSPAPGFSLPAGFCWQLTTQTRPVWRPPIWRHLELYFPQLDEDHTAFVY
jgi:hypothetical protein